MKRILVLTLSVALLALVGLTSFKHLSVTAQSQGNGQQAQVESNGPPETIRHIIHRINPHGADSGFALTVGGTGSLSPISYNGGALINTPTVYLIWYGNWNRGNSTDTPAGQQIIRDFASNVGNSNYFAINKTYSAGGYAINGNVNYGGETTTTGYPYGSRLRDSSVLNIVNDAINSGRLIYDANGVYFVLTSSDVSESSGFCTQYCGWHTAATPSAGHVRYSFVGNAARCLNACAAQTTSPNNNAGVDAMISVIAHELEEATTDADPRSGWVDSSGSENADKCAWTFGSNQYQVANGSWANMKLGIRDYLIQRNLSAADNKCYVDGVLSIQ